MPHTGPLTPQIIADIIDTTKVVTHTDTTTMVACIVRAYQGTRALLPDLCCLRSPVAKVPGMRLILEVVAVDRAAKRDRVCSSVSGEACWHTVLGAELALLGCSSSGGGGTFAKYAREVGTRQRGVPAVMDGTRWAMVAVVVLVGMVVVLVIGGGCVGGVNGGERVGRLEMAQQPL